MLTTETGQYINLDGATTAPHTTSYWFGNNDERVSFDYLLLDNGRVAIHALYGDANKGTHEDYFYGYTSPSFAVGVVCGLIDSVQKFLKYRGVLDSDHGFELIRDLSKDMAELVKPKASLH